MAIAIFFTRDDYQDEPLCVETDGSEKQAIRDAGAELVDDMGERHAIHRATLIEFDERGRATGHCRDVTADVEQASYDYAEEWAADNREWKDHVRAERWMMN